MNTLKETYNSLLSKIEDIASNISDVYNKTNGITMDNVKSSDKSHSFMALNYY